MAHDLEELPLFPLHAVLFPYAYIQLHMFEDRYCKMVQKCVEFDQAFGVVLLRAGEVCTPMESYMVGTAVRILEVHNLANGRMDIRVRGERRFRVRRMDESGPYPVGSVEPVVELEIEHPAKVEALVMETTASFKMLIMGKFARPEFNIQIQLPPDPTALSFVMANFLELQNIEKQRLLEMTDTLERLEELRPLIEKQIVESPTQAAYRVTSAHLREWIFPN